MPTPDQGPQITERTRPARAAIEPVSELVQDLVGGCVIGLADVAESAGDRREKHGEFEGAGADEPNQVEGAVELGLENAIEGLDRFLTDELVLDETRAVDQADGFSEAGAPLVEDSRESGGIAHVGLGIGDGRSGFAQDLEVLADFPSAGERLIARLDLGGACRAGRRGEAAHARAALISGFGGQAGGVGRFAFAGQGGCSDHEQGWPPGACQLGGDESGDAASTAGDEHRLAGFQLESGLLVQERC